MEKYSNHHSPENNGAENNGAVSSILGPRENAVHPGFKPKIEDRRHGTVMGLTIN